MPSCMFAELALHRASLIAMANHLKSPFTQYLLFLLSCTAAIVAASSRPQLSHTIKSPHPQPEDFQNERLYKAYLVIQRFKKSITCDPMNITSTWAGHDICGRNTYAGFQCTSLPGYDVQTLTVTSVDLDGFGLCAPTLRGFVDQLPDLALFQASSNNFGVFDDIPSLAGLTYQYKLDITDDSVAQPFAGSRRSPTKNLVKVVICVQGTCITIGLNAPLGTGGSENGVLLLPGVTDAKALLLNYNSLSGPLPVNIGFSRLSYLALASNKLTGPIPTSIGHLQDSLLELLLLNNQLSGCLPEELGMLSKTVVIDAGKNQLTGPIPSSFSCLSSVEQLNLGGNRLYGEVPDALCKLAGSGAGRLANLTLSSNYFTSVGLACSSMIKEGMLDVKRNCIPGLDNQRGPAECAAFLSQPKACPASAQVVACPAAHARKNAAHDDYSSYVTYATLNE